DVDRYPIFRDRLFRKVNTDARIGGVWTVPKAIGEVTYIDAEAIEAECRQLAAVLDEQPGAFRETFMSSPSPGIVAMALKNEYYDSLDSYLEALGRALRVEYEAIVRNGFILQIDAPDLGLERHVSFKDEPLPVFQGFVEKV